jgi:hypothetical protein
MNGGGTETSLLSFSLWQPVKLRLSFAPTEVRINLKCPMTPSCDFVRCAQVEMAIMATVGTCFL